MKNAHSGISVRLTRISVGIAVVLGILMSFCELFIDLVNQKTQSKASTDLIVRTVTPLASKVAYELNEYSAEDVITGIFAYPIILSAEIKGDRDQVLARRERVIPHSEWGTLLNWAFSDVETIHTVLIHDNYDFPVGELNVEIDIAHFSQQVIDRFITSLMFGVLRNMVLAVILLFFFQKYLTRPILSISDNLKHMDSRSIDYSPIPNVGGHEDDELGGLVSSINSHLRVKTEVGQQLRRSQRIQSLGQLTGGIAHDFSNILGIVLGNLQLLQRRVADDKQSSGYAQEALNGVKRGRELTRKLLNYARSEPGDESRIKVDELVNEITELLSRSLPLETTVEVHLAENIWPVKANAGDLQDALLNLTLNAKDAMADGGRIFIEVSNKKLDANYVQLNPEASAGDFVMISVSDSGAGMSADVIENAVEPFYTTKREGDGTGLGLSMVYSFVRRTGGSIKIYSEVGFGTTVRLYLPRNSNGEVAKSESDLLLESPRGNETILLVDDELALVKVTVETLRSLGYSVLSCYSAEQALPLLRKNKDIDLLLTDVIMPGGMDGYELSLQVRKFRPDVKILVTSGYTKKREEYLNGDREFLDRLVGNLLVKPYSVIELAYSIRRILDKV